MSVLIGNDDNIVQVGVSTVSDHGALVGLLDDDHTQYLKLLGRSGGQSAYGGVVASENLTLVSTSHATKGLITLGATNTASWDEPLKTFGLFAPATTTVQPGISFSSKTGSKWWLQSDGSGSFNGVTDNVLQFGYNASNFYADANDIRWAMQFEANYQPDADPDSTLSEWHLNFYNKPGDEFGQSHRPIQINAYWKDYAGYTRRNKYELRLNGHLTIGDSTGGVGAISVWDWPASLAGSNRSIGDIEIHTNLIAVNNSRYLKQRNAANTGWRSLLFLDGSDNIRIGDADAPSFTTPVNVSVPGKLTIGSNAHGPNGELVYVTPTRSSFANASSFSALYYGPILSGYTGNGSISGSEYWLNASTTPASSTIPFIASAQFDGPTFTLGSGATVTEAAAARFFAPSAASTNWAAWFQGSLQVIAGDIQIASSQAYKIAGSGQLQAVADGVWRLRNVADTTGRLMLGPNSSTGVSVKNVSGELYVRNVGDSAYANIDCALIWVYSNPGVALAGGNVKFYTAGFAGRTQLAGQTDAKLDILDSAGAVGAKLDVSTDGRLAIRNRADSAYGDIAAARHYVGGVSLFISSGSGSPESVVTAPVGSIYMRTDGGAGTSIYIKETGAGNTGWVAK